MSKFMLLLGVCLLAGLLQNRVEIAEWLNPQPPANNAADVVLYATRWCGFCAKTRKFFAKHHIAYRELDVENSEEGRAGYQRLGDGGVPIIVIRGSTVIRGYDPDYLAEALGIQP